MDGFLLVDKPSGISSFGAMAQVRRVLSRELGRKVKIGHTGTLDPAATGLLILVIGTYTKRASEFSELDKTYKAEITLGATSTTGDIEGEITPKSTQVPSKKAVETVLSTFLGKIEQTPPAFSAIKVNGQRAYKLARQGKAVVIEPRSVTVHNIEDIQYNYPKLCFTTSVSSGTYIRSLAEDIGTKLGAGGYLSALRRIKVGEFGIYDALELKKLNSSQISSHLKTFAN